LYLLFVALAQHVKEKHLEPHQETQPVTFIQRLSITEAKKQQEITIVLPPLVFVLQFCPTLGLALLCRIVCTIGERVIDILLHDIPSVFICNTDNFVNWFATV
jgi:hypothetical protein